MPIAFFNVDNIVVLKLAGWSIKLREMNSETVGEIKGKLCGVADAYL
jgi:hypothetical protein